ncbi:hypothetical protein B0T26DRAFT_680781 [Lasiosphaeria miniovina]|uniref:Uncharacterized protein n=1 Tax=Lasiosphaeria miniovina TaxID=1954250 RepID=A0AA39ZSZ3_9PEZI|nr:uncharacterized protein B0T26DRAFT_680781 [Lasiosphaeria miniovina]KAK0703020.1 hypothetical protein B0T26DRAFT_680781 [Lasiosphaeria miniovina]
MANVYLLPSGRIHQSMLTGIAGEPITGRTAEELSSWQTRLEDERHELRRRQRRGDRSAKTAEMLQEVDLNLDIACIDRKLEGLPKKGAGGADERKRVDELNDDRDLAGLQLDLFHREKALRASPGSEDLRKQVENVKYEIQVLDKAIEAKNRP